MKTFKDFGLDTKMLNAIEKLGYDKPTEIQAQTIEPAIDGSDILGIAQTGSGKTAAFLIPLIKKLAEGKAKARMPRGLILTPTRELAAQIYDNYNELSNDIKLSSTLIIGGTSYQEQQKSLNTGVDIIIGTPGRIYDHLERQNVMLHGIHFLVIDEADRMLDEGFIPQVEMICSRTSPQRQTLFFSATMNPEIEKISDNFLTFPLRIEVNPQASVSDDIEQLVYLIDPRGTRDLFKKKRTILRKIISSFGDDLTNAIIFSNTKSSVDILQSSMKVHHYKSESIHGDHTQTVRTEALTKFRNGEIQFLIASDVASRGLDIPLVSHIINFDVPSNPEDYIHRIGRTGRAGNRGTSVTLCSKKELPALDNIESLISQPLNKYKIMLKGRSQDLKIIPIDEVQKSKGEKSKIMTDNDIETELETQLLPSEDNKSYPKQKRKKKRSPERESNAKNQLGSKNEHSHHSEVSPDNMESMERLEEKSESGPQKPVKRRWSYRKKDLPKRKSKHDSSSAINETDDGVDNFSGDITSDELPVQAEGQTPVDENHQNTKRQPRDAGQKDTNKTRRSSNNAKNRGFEGRTPSFVFYEFD